MNFVQSQTLQGIRREALWAAWPRMARIDSNGAKREVLNRQEAETKDRALGGPRRMLNEKQVLGIIPVSRTTLYRMVKAGRFPRSTYISANRRVWFEDEIVAWQNAVDEFNPNRGRGKGRRRNRASS
jgi:prophage regulatory protein